MMRHQHSYQKEEKLLYYFSLILKFQINMLNLIFDIVIGILHEGIDCSSGKLYSSSNFLRSPNLRNLEIDQVTINFKVFQLLFPLPSFMHFGSYISESLTR
jgi:hypothetical protein